MKKFGKITILLFLLLIYIYVCDITFLPNSVVLFEGETLNLRTISGVSVEGPQNKETKEASSNLNTQKINEIGTTKATVNLFGSIPIKDVTVNVIPKTSVIPLGTSIGMKLYTKGVLVVGMSEIEDENRSKKKPYENTGIKEGDMIIAIDNTTVSSTNQLIEKVNESEGNDLSIRYLRDNETKETNITPIKQNENEYKIGLWVRDATAGVGTLTYYEPSTGMFACLGHGIVDIDTSEIVNIANGELVTTNIVSIVKGEKGKPGEIRGTIDGGKTIGTVSKNTNFGVYGILNNPSYLGSLDTTPIEVATREEIKEGKAQIICQLEDNKKETYEIEIQKIYMNNNRDNKSMLIRVTDQKLLEKTGGIIQGMSGCPIIQNGKFVGAVTNVLVNDPTAGYGIFGDMMIKQMKET